MSASFVEKCKSERCKKRDCIDRNVDTLKREAKDRVNEIKDDTDETIYNHLLNLVKSFNTHKTRKNVVIIFEYDNYVDEVQWKKTIFLNDCIYDTSKREFVEPNIKDYINLGCGYVYKSEEDITNVMQIKKDIIKIFK